MGRGRGGMASAALPGREEVGWRPGKRPRPGVVRAPVVAGRARRSAFDEHKKMLLAREQERERRHVEEVRGGKLKGRPCQC